MPLVMDKTVVKAQIDKMTYLEELVMYVNTLLHEINTYYNNYREFGTNLVTGETIKNPVEHCTLVFPQYPEPNTGKYFFSVEKILFPLDKSMILGGTKRDWQCISTNAEGGGIPNAYIKAWDDIPSYFFNWTA